AGKCSGQDLFVANYDWRLLPGPIENNNDGLDKDGNAVIAGNVFDGKIHVDSQKTQNQPQFEYGVDYLVYWLKQAQAEWQEHHNGQQLDKVDIIAHSTGGLVARTYIQSDIYGVGLP